MSFDSYFFIFIFLPAAVTGFWFLLHRFGRPAAHVWLTLVSLAFYAYNSWWNLVIILPSIILDFGVATGLQRLESHKLRWRRLLFIGGLIANIAILGCFKYKSFLLETLNSLFSSHFDTTETILPLGISFLTFQKIAFLADVQAGKLSKVRFRDFVLFCLFFPRTIAGPIIHYTEVIPQLTQSAAARFISNAPVAICLFSIGLFKKTVIADGVAQFVPFAFEAPWNQPPTLINAWTGVLAYTLQLYFDFSGYSDMALGLARMFGVQLPMNFNSPFKASSIVEFWSRWHITLTRFLTEYIYNPIVLSLTRARAAKGRSLMRGKHSAPSAIATLVAMPTIVTMTISGLWHGAGWQFVVWGMLHGVYLVINQTWRLARARLQIDRARYARFMKPVGFVLTFSAVVIAFTFFRAPSLSAAVSILRGMVGWNGVLYGDLQALQRIDGELSSHILNYMQPFDPLERIAVLLIAVFCLPNSLQLLRGFHPALDYPEGEHSRGVLDAPMRGGPYDSGVTPYGVPSTTLRTKWKTMKQNCSSGVALDMLTALAAAILWVFGVMALSAAGPFLYGKF